MTTFKVSVEIESCVPLSNDLEVLDRMGISLTGYTYKEFSKDEKVLMFTLDFKAIGRDITIYI